MDTFSFAINGLHGWFHVERMLVCEVSTKSQEPKALLSRIADARSQPKARRAKPEERHSCLIPSTPLQSLLQYWICSRRIWVSPRDRGERHPSSVHRLTRSKPALVCTFDHRQPCPFNQHEYSLNMHRCVVFIPRHTLQTIYKKHDFWHMRPGARSARLSPLARTPALTGQKHERVHLRREHR